MIVTVDIGNSRIKWALWMVEKIIDRGVISYGEIDRKRALDQLFSTLQKPEKVLALCVAGEEMQKQLSGWVEQNWQLRVDYLKTQKRYKHIIHAYKDPAKHGVDRWAAAIAGYQMFTDSAVCVICAGTAITFDLIDKDARHLGGYILPSHISMCKALSSDTSNINVRPAIKSGRANAENQDSSLDSNLAIPDNTNAAVNLGVHKMLQAGIREICQHASEKLGGSMQILITGGASKSILDYPQMPAMLYKPDLIMQGLYDIKKHEFNSKI